jgi:hypothetical protein
MIKRLRRWLGWDSESGPFDFGDLEIPTPQAPSKAAAHPVPPKPGVKRVPAAPPAAKPASAAKKPARSGPLDGPRTLEILDNPKLTLDRSNDDGFDPYNTGAFNRSASWEKISRHKR